MCEEGKIVFVGSNLLINQNRSNMEISWNFVSYWSDKFGVMVNELDKMGLAIGHLRDSKKVMEMSMEMCVELAKFEGMLDVFGDIVNRTESSEKKKVFSEFKLELIRS